MSSLNLLLNDLRRQAGLSGAEVHRRLIRQGVALNGSTVSRWFTGRADACTPSPGQLCVLLDTLGANDDQRLAVLRAAGDDATDAADAAA